jgi:hypothetical protein
MNDILWHEVLEIALTVLSGLTLTLAAIYIAHGLWCRRSLRPRYVWMYVGFVVTATALWRWAVLLLYGLPDEADFSALATALIPWINPISATLLLAVAGSRRRSGDGR